VRRFTVIAVPVAFLLTVAGCETPPGRDQALQEFERVVEMRRDLHCEDAQVVGAFTKARRIRQYGIQATCSHDDSPMVKSEYFKVEYAKLVSGWELSAVLPVPRSTVELLDSKEPMKSPAEGGPIPEDAIPPILFLALPVVIASVLFGLMLLLLRFRKTHTVERPAGAGISVPHGMKKPAQTKSHWTINPLE